jgi:hypothetical protein
LPIRMTLFTLPAIAALHSRNSLAKSPVSGSPKTPALSHWLERRYCLRYRLATSRDCLELTLYACRSREPDDPRLSTYSTPSAAVPVLFPKIAAERPAAGIIEPARARSGSRSPTSSIGFPKAPNKSLTSVTSVRSTCFASVVFRRRLYPAETDILRPSIRL